MEKAIEIVGIINCESNINLVKTVSILHDVYNLPNEYEKVIYNELRGRQLKKCYDETLKLVEETGLDFHLVMFAKAFEIDINDVLNEYKSYVDEKIEE